MDLYLPLILHVVDSSIRLRSGNMPSQLRDDIVAEILLSIIDNDFAVLRRFRGQSSLGTYLVVVSRRIAMRALARQTHSRRAKPLGNSAAAVVASPEDLAIEDAEEVQSLLEKMPGKEATVIRMFHLEHRSYGDIGNVLGIPENSVGPLLSKARLTMRALRS